MNKHVKPGDVRDRSQERVDGIIGTLIFFVIILVLMIIAQGVQSLMGW
jgi:hypothetical protein